MANEFTITDIVDKSAFEQLTRLQTEFGKTLSAYKEMASEMGASMKTPVSSYDDLTKKVQAYDEIQRKMLESEKNLATMQEKMTKTLKDVTSKIKEKTKATKDSEMTEEKRKRTIQDALEVMKREVHSIKEAQDANRELRKAVKLVRDTDDNYRKTLDELNSTIVNNTNYIKRNSDAYTQQKMTVGDYRQQVKLALTDMQSGGGVMKNFGIIARNVGGIMRTNLSTGMNQVTDGLSTMIKGFVGAQAIVGGFQKLISAISGGIDAIIGFEAANSKLAAILGVNIKEVADLEANARKLGSTTKYTASQATELQIELAKLGFTRSEILDSTKAVLQFAQATGSELSEAAALAGASIRMFGDSTKNIDRYVSAMAVSTTKSALSFSKLATALPIVGPVANAFNFTIEDTLALLGKLADAGFDASAAATATRNIFLNLADSGGKLAKGFGGPVKTLPELVNALIELRDKGVDLNETLEMTDKRSVAAFNAFLSSAEAIAPLRDEVTGVTDDMSQMADTMSNNVQGALLGLQSAWEGLMLSFSNSTGPMKSAIDFLSRGIRNITNELKTYDERQADRDQQEKERVNEEIKNSEVIEKHRKRMQNLYDEYVKSGMDADEAAKTAKQEYLDTLRGNLASQTSTYEAVIQKRKGYEKELDRGFWSTLVSWNRTNRDIENDINNTMIEAAGKKGLMQITQNVIDNLDAIDLTATGNAGGGSGFKELTNAEKKAAEKAAKERQKIAEDLAQSEVDIMAEGLEKEIAQISLNYDKKMAAIQGNSEEEKQLRANLAVQMQNEITKVTEKDNEEWQKRLEDRAKKSLQTMQKYFSDEQKERTNAMNVELAELETKYAQGLISKEEYERRSLEITQRYAIETAQASVDSLESLLRMQGLNASDRLQLEQELAKAKADLAKKTADIQMENEERVTKNAEEESNKRKQNIEQYLQVASQIVGALGQLFSNLYEGRINELEEQQEALEDAKDKEIERIDEMEERGAISSEEAEARKRAAEAETAERSEELEKKKADLQYKQAMWQKAANLAQAAIATALAITEALPNIPLSILVGSLGAIQIAAIAAQQIPKYAEGTADAKGGLSLVGDGGKSEAVITDRGTWLTPDTPTLVNLPKHAIVLPDAEALTDLKGLHSDFATIRTGNGTAVVVNNDFNTERMEDILKENNKQLKNLSKVVRNGQRRTEYMQIYGRL